MCRIPTDSDGKEVSQEALRTSMSKSMAAEAGSSRFVRRLGFKAKWSPYYERL